MNEIRGLVGVYDADGGLRGELAYLAGKARGRHCSLCDITHSPVRRRREWDAYVATLPVPFEVVHRNERDPRVAEATAGHEPCVVAHCSDGRVVMLLDDTALRTAGSVDGMRQAVAEAMDREGLSWPAAAVSGSPSRGH